MRRLANIGSRAAIGFALAWTITAATVVCSALLASNASDVLEKTLVAHADDLMHASRAEIAAERMVAIGRGYLLTRDPAALARVRAAEDELDRSLQALDRDGLLASEVAQLREVQRTAADYRSLLDSAFTSSAATDARPERANQIREQLLLAREALGGDLESLVTHEQQLRVAARRRAADAAARSVRVTIGMGATALVLGAGLAGWFTARLRETSAREQASARRAVRALATRDELLGVVAHDLRSPLASIALRASLIARGHGDEETTRSTTAIQSVCSRMSHLIESLLDAAGIEQGGLRLVPARMPVDPLVRSVVETFSPVAGEKAIGLSGTVTPTDLEVWADRERMFQVLSNLVANAIKFTPEHGSITLVARAELRGVRFDVTDSGCGIEASIVPRVFERFWKADPQSPRGAGLGLYIAKGIVEAHGGRIWVESTPGVGSSFRLEIPAAPPDEARAMHVRPSCRAQASGPH
ncbi:MAG TPA: HAMP domain-containing sensor histidine kinase [Polyangia bacterium]|nr:HAMP domain-containing sensor histidine kinase [Polyangia bacterium]